MPIIKVSDSKLRLVWVGLPINVIVIRLQDLLTQKNFEFNKTLREIAEAGGIHKFLNFHGTIILSLIMKDQIIAETTAQKYIEIIKMVKPNYCTSVDGETYEEEFIPSILEIGRSYLETKKIIESCPEVKFIGLVKGCSKFMISAHINLLKRLKITDFIFHIGDFSRHGTEKNKSRAKEYALHIRKKVDKLYLYGAGSQKKLIENSFADGCVSFNYFIKARNGEMYQGTNSIKYVGKYNVTIVRHNLIEMIKNNRKIKYQKRLFEGGICTWEEVQEEKEVVILEHRQPATEAI